MPSLTLKPTHKAVTAYYDSLAKFAGLGVTHETAVRSAFQELLEHCARQFDWKLVPEYAIKRKDHANAVADGALLDHYGLNHGLWEAKDSADDLDKEIRHKFSIGYPRQNILFWQPDRAVLYREGERFYDAEAVCALHDLRWSGGIRIGGCPWGHFSQERPAGAHNPCVA